MRSRAPAICAVLLGMAAACSSFGGDSTPSATTDAGPDVAAPDADGADAATSDASNADAPPAADATDGLLSYDDFEDPASTSCGAWSPQFGATAESSTAAASSGARSCHLCVGTGASSGNAVRVFDGVAKPGTYELHASVRTDGDAGQGWQLILFGIVDGGTATVTANAGNLGDTFATAQANGSTSGTFTSLEAEVRLDGTGCLYFDDMRITYSP